MPFPSPLRALCDSDPVEARKRIFTALVEHDGHRARAAAHLAKARVEGRKPWLPKRDSYRAMWRCIVALGMGEEVRARWPAPSDPRGAATPK